jgi:enamine deaminase RidA (YjgF/YER057c/UK114 family)
VHGPGRPAGSQIGNIILSATLTGRDEEGTLPEDPRAQIHELFRTMTRFLDAAGATIDEVIRVNLRLTEPALREFVNEEWAILFHDEESLPTRIATFGPVAGDAIAELDLMAVTGN